MHDLPTIGFVRIGQIIGDVKTTPPTPAIIPISRSHLWALVKTGQFPKPVKLGARCTAWTVELIRDYIASVGV